MRYTINTNRIINQLVPRNIAGRKAVLFLEGILSPLQSINDWFCNWAYEIRIEAAMTSQVFYFEWYLNRKFKKYFSNADDKITISDGTVIGNPMYFEGAGTEDNMILYNENENKESEVLMNFGESNTSDNKSFIVSSPAINNIVTEEEYINILSSVIDKYKTATKTYIIKIDKA